MKGMKVTVVVAVMLVAGCTAGNVKEVRTEDGKPVKVYEGVPPVKYKALKQVSAMDCAATWFRKANEENAINMLKQKVVAMGGNGIASVRCHAAGMSFKHNCNNSYTCEGVAVRVE